ncbi:MAG TPA: hypothetical protein VFC80_03765 [Sphaerochaeta sp.]|nr:hypothetical protein [Sphaerochaeta sp.]
MKKRIFTIGLVLTLVLPLFAFDFFFDEGPSRNISFEVETGVQTFVDDWAVAPIANITLKAEQDGANYQAIAELSYDSELNSIEAQELSISLFMGSVTLKAGLMRHKWGSADTASVVDVVNGRDMRRGIIDDPDKMKRPDLMLTLTKYWENSSVDFVFKPGFNPSLVAMDDSQFSVLDDQTKLLLAANPVDVDALIPNTRELQKFSAGARYRFTFDPMDIALMYYYGYNHDPGFTVQLAFDFSNFPNVTVDPILGSEVVAFTRHQFIGLSSSLFLEPFTFALEGGMFLSEDSDGTMPELYNSKLVYLAEISYTNPSNALFLAFNYQGQMVLNYSADLEPSPTYPWLDTDLMAAFNYRPYQNNFAVAVEVPFMREKLKVRAAGTYQLESQGFAIMGSTTYEFSDDVQLYAKSTIYGCSKEERTGMFTTWKDNTWIQVGVRAWF